MKTKDEIAKTLADIHYTVEDGMTHIYRLTSPNGNDTTPQEPIKLLEFTTDTIAAGIMPLNFGKYPEKGIDYPTVIIEITPEEFEQIRANELKLPHGWALGPELPRP